MASTRGHHGYEAYNSTLDRAERIQQIAQMEKLVNEDVAAIPLFYTPRMIAHVAGLRGPVARASRHAMELVHVSRWELVSWERGRESSLRGRSS